MAAQAVAWELAEQPTNSRCDLPDLMLRFNSTFMKTKPSTTSRRNFLKSTMTLPVALAAAPTLFTPSARAADAPAPAAGEPLPRRQLGKIGPQVTMLGMGGMMAALSPDYIDIAWSMGIRYFDTAHVYLNGKSEKIFAAWLAKYPERRKEIFLVSKDMPRNSPAELLDQIDKRLEACGSESGCGLVWRAGLAKERRIQNHRRGAEKIRQGQDGRLFLPRRDADGLFERGGGRRISRHHHASVQSVLRKGRGV